MAGACQTGIRERLVDTQYVQNWSVKFVKKFRRKNMYFRIKIKRTIKNRLILIEFTEPIVPIL